MDIEKNISTIDNVFYLWISIIFQIFYIDLDEKIFYFNKS